MHRFRCRLLVKLIAFVFVALCVCLFMFPDDSIEMWNKVFIGFSFPVCIFVLWFVLTMFIEINNVGLRCHTLFRDAYIKWSDVTRVRTLMRENAETVDTVLYLYTSQQSKPLSIPVMWFHVRLLREIVKNVPSGIPVDISEFLERRLAGKRTIFYKF